MSSPAAPRHVATRAVADVVVLVGGDPVPLDRLPPLPPAPFVIAADSGLHLASRLQLEVDLIVGDLDSVDLDELTRAQQHGVPVERYPVAKDRTDLAIALDAACRLAPQRVTLVGGHGGRLDHVLGNALVLADDAYAAPVLTAYVAGATVTVVRGRRQLRGVPDELVSLLPVHGPARGVRTDGLRFPLDGQDLPPGSTRGISNQFTRDRATVEVAAGVLLAVQPGELGPRTGGTL